MSRQDVLALLREQEGAFVSGEGDQPPAGTEPRGHLEGGGCAAEGGLHCGGPHRPGLPSAGCAGRADGTGDPPLSGETARVGRTLVCLAEVDSTNLRARQLAAEGAADGTVVVADRQTAGRGRLGRSFQSPGGQGIYLTALLRPDLPPEAAVAGDGHGWSSGVSGRRAAVRRQPRPEMAQRSGAGWEKALRYFDRALPGGETARVQELVLGIGINVSQRPEDFTPEVREIATSLVQALGHAVSRPALAAEIIREVDRLCAALAAGETGPYLAEYRRRCVNLGRTVRLLRPDGGGETAEALDIDEEFGLVVGGGRTAR